MTQLEPDVATYSILATRSDFVIRGARSHSPYKVTMWWIALVLQLSSLELATLSDAQLSPPIEAVCLGQQVQIVCQQLGGSTTWKVNLQRMMLRVLAPREVGGVEMFPDDPGFAFEVVTTDFNTSIVSELRVTAVRELNGVTVDCEGFSGTYMSEIQVATVGESHVE